MLFWSCFYITVVSKHKWNNVQAKTSLKMVILFLRGVLA